MKALSSIARPLFAPVVFLLAGCSFSYLESYQRDIDSSTRDIDNARDDAHRAAAYSKRGSAYSEKARYSRAFKLIPAEEYERLFSLAIKDHDKAIALNPASAEVYHNRGQAYYDRANLETVVDGKLVVTGAAREAWFAPAAADFRKAIDRDSKNAEAWDMLGLTHESAGELDEAIEAYSQEAAMNSLGKSRLAEAYCERAGYHGKDLDAAIADYEKSIESGANSDGCSCDPYNPLVHLYTETGRYDQSWAVVHMALKAKKWVAPEMLAGLKKVSGRSN
jgi:tetratricopeptide (TPR) repeat protein